MTDPSFVRLHVADLCLQLTNDQLAPASVAELRYVQFLCV